MLTLPTQGDILLRGSRERGFQLLDYVSGETVVGELDLDDAIDVALSMTAGAVWQQNLDAYNRPLGSPVCLLSSTGEAPLLAC